MTSINTSLSSLYQLANLLSSGSGSSTSSSSGTAGTNTLAQLLNAVEATSSQSGSSSYLLDLSQQAQDLLNGTSSTSSTALSSSGSGSSNFTLTSAQESKIEAIIAKYKDAPFDQATFNEIQSDLQQAGLSPQTLGAEDQVKSFNSTNVLLQDLSGNYTPAQSTSTAVSNEQNKESSYMQNILSYWKSVSTTATSSASGTSAA